MIRTFNLPYNQPLHLYKEWLVENIGPGGMTEYIFFEDIDNNWTWTINFARQVTFVNDEDATLFKLKFGDDIWNVNEL